MHLNCRKNLRKSGEKKKHLKEGRFLGFKPLPEKTNAKQSIIIFYLNYNGSQLKTKIQPIYFFNIKKNKPTVYVAGSEGLNKKMKC